MPQAGWTTGVVRNISDNITWYHNGQNMGELKNGQLVFPGDTFTSSSPNAYYRIETNTGGTVISSFGFGMNTLQAPSYDFTKPPSVSPPEPLESIDPLLGVGSGFELYSPGETCGMTSVPCAINTVAVDLALSTFAAATAGLALVGIPAIQAAIFGGSTSVAVSGEIVVAGDESPLLLKSQNLASPSTIEYQYRNIIPNAGTSTQRVAQYYDDLRQLVSDSGELENGNPVLAEYENAVQNYYARLRELANNPSTGDAQFADEMGYLRRELLDIYYKQTNFYSNTYQGTKIPAIRMSDFDNIVKTYLSDPQLFPKELPTMYWPTGNSIWGVAGALGLLMTDVQPNLPTTEQTPQDPAAPVGDFYDNGTTIVTYLGNDGDSGGGGGTGGGGGGYWW